MFTEGAPVIVAPAELMDAAAKLAHRTVGGTSQWVNIPVVKDTEVGDEVLRKHHLILLGSPAINKVTARLAGMEKNWPVAMDNGSVALDKNTSYSLSQNVVEVITYHPLNRALRVWAVLTDGPDGLPANSPIIKDVVPWVKKPDITVTEIKSNKVLEYRLLTTDWKPQASPMRTD